MTTVLILGGGIMQMPAVRIAKAKGWRVVLADANPDAIARDVCDGFHLVDLKDKEGMADLAARLKENLGLDGIFTAGTDFSSTVAWACEKLGLPGIPYKTAMNATDKCLMRAAFDKNGVPSPSFACWTGAEDPRSSASGIPYPIVVKPVDNMGARGVRRVEDPEELEKACAAALALSRSRRVIIEEYMEGPELSLDAVVYRGEITVCGVADRHIRFPPYFVEMGHTMPTELDAMTARKVEEVFAAGIRAVGIETGAAKGDIKLTKRGPMVGEIAARLSGGYMSGWTFPLSSGVEVTEAALNIAVGLPPGDLKPRWNKISVERAFISIPGRVMCVEGVEEARKASGIKEVFLRATPGSQVVFPTNNVEKCGNVISCHRSRRTAIREAEYALSKISIRLFPLEEASDGFLFAMRPESAASSTLSGRVASPTLSGRDGLDAFTVTNMRNVRALAEMPAFLGDESRIGNIDVMPVIALPKLKSEWSRDWHGRSFGDALADVEKRGGIEFRTRYGEDGFVLGKAFWRAFLRGGTQGALYLLDSLREAEKKRRLREYLSKIWG